MSKESYFDSSLRGWIVNTAAQEHKWLSDRYDIDDLIQEGHVCFCKCWNMYQPLFDVAEPNEQQHRHFMALVQSAFRNHLLNMHKRSKHEKRVLYTSDWPSWVEGIADEVATILVLLQQAPTEIKDMLNTLTSDFEPEPRRNGAGPEYWDRVLGEPDVVAKLTRYFSTST